MKERGCTREEPQGRTQNITFLKSYKMLLKKVGAICFMKAPFFSLSKFSLFQYLTIIADYGNSTNKISCSNTSVRTNTAATAEKVLFSCCTDPILNFVV